MTTSSFKSTEKATTDLQLARALLHLRKATGPQARLALAEAELLNGTYEQAEQAARQVLEAQPKSFAAQVLLAEIMFQAGRYEKSWTAAMTAIKLDRQNEKGWLIAAYSSLKGGNQPQTVRSLELYIKIRGELPINPQIFLLLAHVEFEQHHQDKALQRIQQAEQGFNELFVRPSPDFLTLKARICAAAGRRLEAQDLYRQVLQLRSSDAQIYYELGKVLADDKDELEEAFKVYKQALLLDETQPEYYYECGRLALASATEHPARLLQATDWLKRATELDDEPVKYWQELGQAYLAAKNYKAGRPCLKHAIGQAVKHNDNAALAQCLRLYAACCKQTGDLADARAALKQLLDLTDNDAIAWNELGELYYHQKDWQTALDCFSQALAQEPGNALYLANSAKTLFNQGDFSRARDLVLQAVKRDPNLAMARYLLGQIFLGEGKLNAALSELQEAARLAPATAEYRFALSQAYKKAKDIASAISQGQEAVALEPLQHAWHAALGELYLQERAPVPALESLQMAIQLAPHVQSYRYHLAIAQAATGAVNEAVKTVRHHLEKDPGAAAQWHFLLGSLLSKSRRPMEAHTALLKAYELEPENTQYKIELARSLMLLEGKIDQARRLLEEVVRAEPNNWKALSELSRLQEEEGDLIVATNTLASQFNAVLMGLTTN